MVKGVLKDAKRETADIPRSWHTMRCIFLFLSFLKCLLIPRTRILDGTINLYFRHIMCQISCRGLTQRPITICYSVPMGKMQRKTFQMFKEYYKSSNGMHL